LQHKSVLLDDRVRGLCAIASDRELAVGASDGEIHIVRMPELDLRQKIDAHDLSVEALAWDPQRQWLFAASEDGVVSIWQRTDGIFVEHFRIRLNLGRIRKIHYLADSDALAVLVQGETAVRLIAVDRLCGMMQEMSLLH